LFIAKVVHPETRIDAISILVVENLIVCRWSFIIRIQPTGLCVFFLNVLPLLSFALGVARASRRPRLGSGGIVPV
jgi:hypothetical protein